MERRGFLGALAALASGVVGASRVRIWNGRPVAVRTVPARIVPFELVNPAPPPCEFEEVLRRAYPQPRLFEREPSPFQAVVKKERA
jgi:hypothetical protein